MRLLLLVILLCLFAYTPADIHAQTKNEISFHSNLVRGGFEPYKFFDGTAIGFTYNREIHPYIMVHTNLVAVQMFDGDELWIDHNHNNGLINSDIGVEIAPFEFKKFQVRFGFAGSVQVRNSVESMDPETLSGRGSSEFSTIYSFRSYHLGYKFELKFPVQLFERFFVAPISTIRSYPRGNYIPNSLEVGIQGGIKF